MVARDDREGAVSTRDRGAALIVAVGFVLMIGMIGAGLTTMITSGLGNRAALEQVRNRQYAADGAIETAVASMRTAIETAVTACGDESVSTTELNGVTIRVDVLTVCGAIRDPQGLPVVQTSGVFTACVDEGAPCADDTATLRALVGFERTDDGSVVQVVVHSWSVLR
jgi:hypothetical protein